MNPTNDHPGVIVTLPEIYKQVLETDEKLDRLANSVEQMVSINKRLDQHHERLNEHGQRMRKAESQIAAQWIVVGVVITVIGAALVKFITG